MEPATNDRKLTTLEEASPSVFTEVLSTAVRSYISAESGVTLEKHAQVLRQKSMRQGLLKSVLADLILSSEIESLPLEKSVQVLAAQMVLGMEDSSWSFKEWANAFAFLDYLNKTPLATKNGERLEKTWERLVPSSRANKPEAAAHLKRKLRFLVVDTDWKYSTLTSLRQGEILSPSNIPKPSREHNKALLLSLTNLIRKVLPYFKGEFEKLKSEMPKADAIHRLRTHPALKKERTALEFLDNYLDLLYKIEGLQRIYNARRGLVAQVLERLFETLESSGPQKWNESLIWYTAFTRVTSLLQKELDQSLPYISKQAAFFAENLPESTTKTIASEENLTPFAPELEKEDHNEIIHSLLEIAAPQNIEKMGKCLLGDETSPFDMLDQMKKMHEMSATFRELNTQMPQIMQKLQEINKANEERHQDNLRSLDAFARQGPKEAEQIQELRNISRTSYRFLKQLEERFEFLKKICAYTTHWQSEFKDAAASSEELAQEAKKSPGMEFMFETTIRPRTKRKTHLQTPFVFSVPPAPVEEPKKTAVTPSVASSKIPEETPPAQPAQLPWQDRVSQQPLMKRLDTFLLPDQARLAKNSLENAAFHLGVLQSNLTLLNANPNVATHGVLRCCATLLEQALSARLSLEAPDATPGHHLPPMAEKIESSPSIRELAQELDYGVVFHRFPQSAFQHLRAEGKPVSKLLQGMLENTPKTAQELEKLIHLSLSAMEELLLAPKDSFSFIFAPAKSPSAKQKAALKQRLAGKLSSVQSPLAELQAKIAKLPPAKGDFMQALHRDIALHVNAIQALLKTLQDNPTTTPLLALGDQILMHLQHLDEQMEQAIHFKNHGVILPTHSVQKYRAVRNCKESPHHQQVVFMLNIQALEHYPAYYDKSKKMRGFLQWRLDAEALLAKGENVDREAASLIDFIPASKNKGKEGPVPHQLLVLQDQLAEWTLAVVEMTQARLDLIR